MAALGTTSDPKELIPGDPAAITGVADDLRTKAGVLGDVATDLGNVRIPGWDGKGSSAFWDKFSPEKSNWEMARDAMTSAAGTLDGHSSSLEWAQGQAGEAIDLWERGQQATKSAMTEFESSGGTFSAGTTPGAAPNTPGGPTPVGGSFTDPGASLRKEAQEVLERARNQLDEAGNTNASALDEQAGKGKGAPNWLTGPAQIVDQKGPQKVAVDIKQTETWLEKAERKQDAGSRFAKYGQWGEQFEKKQGPGVNVTLAEAKASAELFKTSASGATQIGDVTLGGQAEFKALSAEASASGGISRDGLTGQLKAGAYLAEASARGSATYGIAEVGGSGRAYVGAEAGAQGSIGKDGVQAGVNAFAGAKATGEVHADVGGVGAGVTGEAWAGVGAEANVGVGKNDDGSWTIGAEAGVGLGVGAKLGFEVTVDPDEVTDTIGDAASAINPFD